MYYPKSQIVTDLYSNGDLVYKTDQSQIYNGPYWKTSQGKFFSGKNPQDRPTVELVASPSSSLITTSVSSNNLVIIYNADSTDVDPDGTGANEDLNGLNIFSSNGLSPSYVALKGVNYNDTVYLPSYSPNIPNDSDYQIGEYRRYFCKKINEIIYIEIDKATFNLLKEKNNKITWQYYYPFNIPWQLTGDKEKVYITKSYINYYTGQFTIVKLPPLISTKDELVPTSNFVSYSGRNGEINNMIAPVKEMKGDTMILKSKHWASDSTIIIYTKIVLE